MLSTEKDYSSRVRKQLKINYVNIFINIQLIKIYAEYVMI